MCKCTCCGTTSTDEKLLSDVKAIVADAEALIANATGDTSSNKFVEMKNALLQKVSHAKSKIIDAEECVIEKTKEAARQTNEYVHENPWKSVGVAASVGLLIGFLVGNNKK